MMRKLINATSEELVAALRALKLPGMAEALENMIEHPEEFAAWTWTDRVELLVDKQNERRFNNKVNTCLKNAKFRYPMASLTDVVDCSERNLDEEFLHYLGGGDWVKDKDNLIVTGAAGSGKTYLACAIGVSVCQQGVAVRYARTDDLMRELEDARLAGTYDKVLQRYVNVPLLVLDEFLLSRPSEKQTADLLNLAEKRYLSGSLLVCSQFPPEDWCDRLCDQEANRPLAESILDRVIHNARMLPISGNVSMRERMRHRRE